MKGPHPGVKPISKKKEFTIYVCVPHLSEQHEFSGDITSIYERLLQSFPNMIMTKNDLLKSIKAGMNLLIKDVHGGVIGGVK